MRRMDQRASFDNEKKQDQQKFQKIEEGAKRNKAARAGGRGRGRGRGRSAEKASNGRGARGRGRGRGRGKVASEGRDPESFDEAPPRRRKKVPEPDSDQEPDVRKTGVKEVPSEEPGSEGEDSGQEGANTVRYSQDQPRAAKTAMKRPAASSAKQPGAKKKKQDASAHEAAASTRVAAAKKKREASLDDQSKQRKTFAGRRPPSTEKPLVRYEVLQKVFNQHLAPRFSNPSAWEAGLDISGGLAM